MSRSSLVLALLVLVPACTAPLSMPDSGAPPADSGAPPVDSGAPPVDSGTTPDLGSGSPDLGGTPDAGTHDAGTPDAGSPWGLVADTTFGTGGVASLSGGVLDAWNASACAAAADGSVVIAGSTDSGDTLFVRVGASGALDTTFGTGGSYEHAYASTPTYGADVSLLSDGRVAGLVLGDWNGIVRLTSAGAPDTTFDSDGIAMLNIFGVVAELHAMAVAPDGRVTVAGRVWESALLSSRHDYVFARYRADGTLDPSFDDDGIEQRSFAAATDESATTVALALPDDFVFGGVAGTDGHTVVGRMIDTGLVDTTFGSGGIALPASRTGAVATVVAGGTTLAATDTHVVRLDASGAPDTTFAGGDVTFGGCPLRSMVARAGTDVWVSCDGEGGLRGVDWSGTPRAGGALLAVPAVPIAAGVPADAAVTRVCTSPSGAIVAVGEASEHGTGTARGIFVARFVDGH